MSSKAKPKSSKANNAAEKRRAVRNPKTGRKHTSIACQHCWKSKTRCGIKRPCDRCVRLGHKDCADRPESTRKRQHTSLIKQRPRNKSSTSSSSKKHNKSSLNSESSSSPTPSSANHNNIHHQPHSHSSTLSKLINLPPIELPTSSKQPQIPPPIIPSIPSIPSSHRHLPSQHLPQCIPPPVISNNNININNNKCNGNILSLMIPPPVSTTAHSVTKPVATNTTTKRNIFNPQIPPHLLLPPMISCNKIQTKQDTTTSLVHPEMSQQDDNKHHEHTTMTPKKRRRGRPRKCNKKNEMKENKKRKRRELSQKEEISEIEIEEKVQNISTPSPLKKRRLNARDRRDKVPFNVDAIFLDTPHKEIRPDDSSHYSTEYGTENDEDDGVLFFSHKLDAEKTPIHGRKSSKCKQEEVWSHFAFSPKAVQNFVTIHNSKDNRTRLNFDKIMDEISEVEPAKSRSDKLVKKETSVDRDFRDIMTSIHANNVNQEVDNHENQENEEKSQRKIEPFVYKPKNTDNYSIFASPSLDFNRFGIPSSSAPTTAASASTATLMSPLNSVYMSPTNPFNIRSPMVMFTPFTPGMSPLRLRASLDNYSIFASPMSNDRITRITPLIPTPQSVTNMNMNDK